MDHTPATILVSVETARKLGLQSLPSKFPGCVEVDSIQAKIAAMKCGSVVDSRLRDDTPKKKSESNKAHRKTWDQKNSEEEDF